MANFIRNLYRKDIYNTFDDIMTVFIVLFSRYPWPFEIWRCLLVVNRDRIIVVVV